MVGSGWRIAHSLSGAFQLSSGQSSISQIMAPWRSSYLSGGAAYRHSSLLSASQSAPSPCFSDFKTGTQLGRPSSLSKTSTSGLSFLSPSVAWATTISWIIGLKPCSITMRYCRRGTRRSSSLVSQTTISMLSLLLIRSLPRQLQAPMTSRPPPHCLL